MTLILLLNQDLFHARQIQDEKDENHSITTRRTSLEGVNPMRSIDKPEKEAKPLGTHPCSLKTWMVLIELGELSSRSLE